MYRRNFYLFVIKCVNFMKFNESHTAGLGLMFCTYKEAWQRNGPQTCYVGIHFSFHSVRPDGQLCCSNCLYNRTRTWSKCCTNAYLTQQITQHINPPSTNLTPLPNLSVPWNRWSCRPLAQTHPSAQFSAHFTLSPAPRSSEFPPPIPHAIYFLDS